MITAKDELKHVADTVSEAEAEAYLQAPEMMAACRALLALVDSDPRAYQYDTELLTVVAGARSAVEGLVELPRRE
jgi:hypothetical protein